MITKPKFSNCPYVFKIGLFRYNAFNVYCRELAPGTVSLTGDRAQGDDNKHTAYSSKICIENINIGFKAIRHFQSCENLRLLLPPLILRL